MTKIEIAKAALEDSFSHAEDSIAKTNKLFDSVTYGQWQQYSEDKTVKYATGTIPNEPIYATKTEVHLKGDILRAVIWDIDNPDISSATPKQLKHGKLSKFSYSNNKPITKDVRTTKTVFLHLIQAISVPLIQNREFALLRTALDLSSHGRKKYVVNTHYYDIDVKLDPKAVRAKFVDRTYYEEEQGGFSVKNQLFVDLCWAIPAAIMNTQIERHVANLMQLLEDIR